MIRQNLFCTLPTETIVCFYDPIAMFSSTILDYSGYVAVVSLVCLHVENMWCTTYSSFFKTKIEG